MQFTSQVPAASIFTSGTLNMEAVFFLSNVTMQEATQHHIQEDSNFHIYDHESLRFHQELTFTKMSIILSLRRLFMRSCKVFIALLEVCKSDTIVAE
jgi:hypothetical protein